MAPRSTRCLIASDFPGNLLEASLCDRYCLTCGPFAGRLRELRHGRWLGSCCLRPTATICFSEAGETSRSGQDSPCVDDEIQFEHRSSWCLQRAQAWQESTLRCRRVSSFRPARNAPRPCQRLRAKRAAAVQKMGAAVAWAAVCGSPLTRFRPIHRCGPGGTGMRRSSSRW